jgi:hypothetical protein
MECVERNKTERKMRVRRKEEEREKYHRQYLKFPDS